MSYEAEDEGRGMRVGRRGSGCDEGEEEGWVRRAIYEGCVVGERRRVGERRSKSRTPRNSGQGGLTCIASSHIKKKKICT